MQAAIPSYNAGHSFSRRRAALHRLRRNARKKLTSFGSQPSWSRPSAGLWPSLIFDNFASSVSGGFRITELPFQNPSAEPGIAAFRQTGCGAGANDATGRAPVPDRRIPGLLPLGLWRKSSASSPSIGLQEWKKVVCTSKPLDGICRVLCLPRARPYTVCPTQTLPPLQSLCRPLAMAFSRHDALTPAPRRRAGLYREEQVAGLMLQELHFGSIIALRLHISYRREGRTTVVSRSSEAYAFLLAELFAHLSTASTSPPRWGCCDATIAVIFAAQCFRRAIHLRYERMPIEVESPEEIRLQHDRAQPSLSESSITDQRLYRLLAWSFRIFRPSTTNICAWRWLVPSFSIVEGIPGLSAADVRLTGGAGQEPCSSSSTWRCCPSPGDHLVVVRPSFATVLKHRVPSGATSPFSMVVASSRSSSWTSEAAGQQLSRPRDEANQHNLSPQPDRRHADRGRT